MNTPLTTQDGKVKCLAFQNGRRCGRVASHEMSYNIGRHFRHLVTCDECLNWLREREAYSNIRNVQVYQTSDTGFKVLPQRLMDETRQYIPYPEGR